MYNTKRGLSRASWQTHLNDQAAYIERLCVESNGDSIIRNIVKNCNSVFHLPRPNQTLNAVDNPLANKAIVTKWMSWD